MMAATPAPMQAGKRSCGSEASVASTVRCGEDVNAYVNALYGAKNP